MFVCFASCICVCFAACISTVVCDVAEKARLLMDCVSGTQHSLKTLILVEDFDADLVSRGQRCGIDIISLKDAEVNKPQTVCSNLYITPLSEIDACVCVCWYLFVLPWPRDGSAVVTGWPAVRIVCPQNAVTLKLLFIEIPWNSVTYLPCYNRYISIYFYLNFGILHKKFQYAHTF